MLLLVKRPVQQDKRKSQNRIMILVTPLHILMQSPPNILSLLKRTLQFTDHIVRCWKCTQYLSLILLLESGNQRHERITSSHTVCLLKTRIQRNHYMNVFLLQNSSYYQCEYPRCIYQCYINMCQSLLLLSNHLITGTGILSLQTGTHPALICFRTFLANM